MTMVEHLEELRRRLIIVVAAIGIAAIAGFIVSGPAIDLLRAPLPDQYDTIYFNSLGGAFTAQLKVAGFIGVAIAMPVILWNVWAFVAPGLHKHERKYAAPFVIIGSLLFIAGGAFAIFVVVPFAIQFLVSFGQDQGLKAMITVSSYVDFILKFTLAFGVVFEMPVVITLLSMLGIVTPQFLSKNRKYAILINFIIAAVLTPTPDVVNQSLMAGPLCVLYEVGIICSRVVGRKKAKAAAMALEVPK